MSSVGYDSIHTMSFLTKRYSNQYYFYLLLSDQITTGVIENRKTGLSSFYKTNSKSIRWYRQSNINKCYARSDVHLQISLKSPPDISKYDTGEKRKFA